MGVGLPRGRADGRLRPLLQLQGRVGAGDERVSLVVLQRSGRRPPRLRPRRQRHRRRRLGRGPADGRHHARRAGGRGDRDPPARRDPPLAARAQPAVSGYLRLVEALWADPAHATAFNFGPAETDARPVQWIVDRIGERWPRRAGLPGRPRPAPARGDVAEARLRARRGAPGLAPDVGAGSDARRDRRLVRVLPRGRGRPRDDARADPRLRGRA